MEQKVLALNKLRSTLISNPPLPELAEGATQLVFGGGNPDAEVVIIGEAPGRQEDLSGQPFVGASGRLLDRLLEIAGLRRQDIYITNIVKYRPPLNRDPSPSEKLLFMPYLRQQIEIIKPKLLITLGRHSASCFLPEVKISRDHGQLQSVQLEPAARDSKRVFLLPFYHPAAALYNPSMRSILIADFERLPAVLKQIK